MKLRVAIRSLADPLKHLQSNWIVASSNWGVLLFFLLSLVILLIKLQQLPPLVPLWYSRPWGEDQLAHPLWLALLPLSGMIWHVLNSIVSIVLMSEYPVFVRILMGSSFLINALLLVALVAIVSLVT